MNRPLVIYHGNCADGFSAAWCFWRKYGTGADYVAGVYQLRIRRPRSAEIWMMGLTVLFAMFGALAGCRLVLKTEAFAAFWITSWPAPCRQHRLLKGSNMSWEAWGEPDDGPELPDGWWDEDQVADVEAAVKALCDETLYEDGKKDNGVSVRFLARMSVLKLRAGLAKADEPLIAEALALVGEEP